MFAPRQREIVEALARGEGVKQIAHAQGVSIRTVQGNLELARKKLAAKNVTHLVALAIKKGWIE